MKNYSIQFAICILSALLFSSCQKVIDIDLNSASPQIVVEGSINDQPGPYFINLSETVNFSETNAFPPVTGALVKITDNTGVTDILTEINPGNYRTSTLQGVPGRSYALTISSNGKNYSSVSVMPAPVDIDSLTIVKRQGGFGRARRRLVLHFRDPAVIANFYHFAITHYVVINHVIQYSIVEQTTSITSDKLEDGTELTNNIATRGDTLVTGDSIVIGLQAIDKGTYDYFRTLGQADNGIQSATPANPISNLTNGALGYFSAYAIKSKGIVVPAE